jgi:hypothetical protein
MMAGGRVGRLLTTVLSIAVATGAGCSKSHVPPPARNLAAEAVELLSYGDVRTVAEKMHYPPNYTPQERKMDIAATGNGLDLAAREFGRLSEPKEHAGVAAFYEVGGSGGDVAYLSSLSPHYSAQVLYEAKFAKLGKGYIRITVIQLAADSPFEILGVYFGLPVKDPHSKQAILEITRKQLIQMGVPITPEVEQQMAASLTPVRYPAPQGSSQHVQ